MQIELGHAVGVLVAATAAAGLATRWWFARRLAALARQRDTLDASHRKALQRLESARRQLEDLQRQVAMQHKRCATEREQRQRRGVSTH